jgi:hypothetical protein
METTEIYAPIGYSALSDRIGSSAAARRAGR